MKKVIILLLAACGLAATGPVTAHPGIDEQIAEITARLAASPNDAVLLLRRGELHRVHRDWEPAEADYRAAKAADPDLVVVDFCLARLLVESGRPTAAKPLLDRFLERRPSDTDARALRARVLMDTGQPLAAAKDLDAAIRNAKDGVARPEHYLDRARALAAAGPDHLAEAIAGLDEGLVALGDAVTIELYAIDLELSRHNYDAALKRIDRLASQSARQEPWLIRRAAILEAAGRKSDALGAYRTALASIDKLPASRKTNRAVSRLADEARAGVERLEHGTTTR
jgi:predicted Zn-dependent protease